MVKRIPWSSPLLWVVVFQVAVLAWFAYRVVEVYHDLNAAKSASHKVEKALRDQNPGEARAQEAVLSEHAAAAAAGTSGPVWTVLDHLPFVGDDARTVAQVSTVVDTIAHEVVPPAVDAVDIVHGKGLIGHGGSINLQAVDRITPDLAAARRGISSASKQLAEVNTAGNIEKISKGYADLRKVVGDLSDTMTSADRALSILPAMAGSQGPRRYLLVLQNNAEIRASGGLPGVIVELTANHGRIHRGKPISTSATFSTLTAPVIPLSVSEHAVFGDALGERVMESNLTPDFPRTAQLIAARWKLERGTSVDGVLSMDTVTLAYLLQATGPIKVGGITLTAGNAVQELLANTYIRLAHRQAQQDVFFQSVADEVFSRITSGRANTSDLLRAIARAADEGRLRVRSFHPAEAKVIGNEPVAGILDPSSTRAQTGVYVNDVTSSKMSIFLDYTVNVTSSSCDHGRQHLQISMDLASSAPKKMSDYDVYVTGDGTNAPIGSEALSVTLYPPIGGSIGAVRLGGRATRVERGTLSGRRVAATRLLIGPGQIRELVWTVNTGPGQPGDVGVNVTPGVVPGTKSFTVRTSC